MGPAAPVGDVTGSGGRRRVCGHSRRRTGPGDRTGDLQSLLDQLAPDVVLLGDGGGVKQTVVRPIVGADRVGRLLALGLTRVAGAASAEPAQVNGGPALIIRLDGEIDIVLTVRIDDGLISGLYVVRNPEKLSHIERETTVSR